MSLPVNPEAWVRLGARIRAERERQGMSRKALAERANVSPGSVQSAEKGAVPKGRWPQSLSAIERALGWASDSMRSVLEGGDVEYQPTLFDDSSTQAVSTGMSIQGEASLAARASLTASGEVTRPPTDWWVNQFAHLDVPDDLRKALPQVMYFATLAVRHGADQWAASTFTNIVYLILDEVSQARRKEARAARPTPATVEESDEQLAELDEERNRLLASVQAMEAILDQTPREPGGEMSAGERENRKELAELKRLLEKMGAVREQSEELQTAYDAHHQPEG